MEKKEIEVIDEIQISDRVLNRAREAMAESRANKRAKIKRIMLPGIIGMMMIGIIIPSLIFGLGQKGQDNTSWNTELVSRQMEYSELEKIACESIEEINKNENKGYYWIEGLQTKKSYMLFAQKDLVMIEEEYTYKDITCTLFIEAKNSKVYIVEDYTLLKDTILIKDIDIHFFQSENQWYGTFIDTYLYQLKIETTENEVIEEILTNLRK